MKVSEGCANCYAEGIARRFGGVKLWGPRFESKRKPTSMKNWDKPLEWNRKAAKAGKRARVFCGSMCDVFEDNAELDADRGDLFRLIEDTPHLTWMLLTKRPQNILRMAPREWATEVPDNVWIGTSVENQKAADERIPSLLWVPARVRFISCEPLLGELNLTDYLSLNGMVHHRGGYTPAVNWVIVGGESGPGARPIDSYWARSLRYQCINVKVPFFFKQWGEHDDEGKRVGKGKAGRLLDGVEWNEVPHEQH